jgi:hypothetical protein
VSVPKEKLQGWLLVSITIHLRTYLERRFGELQLSQAPEIARFQMMFQLSRHQETFRCSSSKEPERSTAVSAAPKFGLVAGMVPECSD